MPVSEQIKALYQRFFPKKRMRRTETSSSLLQYMETSKTVSVLLFVLTVAAVVLTSFVGIRPSGVQILPNQLASIRIIASEAFSYPSKVLTERRQEQLLNEVPHVYRIEMNPFEVFEGHVQLLLERMQRYSDIEEDLSNEGAKRLIRRMAEEFNNLGDYRLSVSDLTTILENTDDITRKELFNTGLISLRESYKLGIYNSDDANFSFGPNTVALFHIANQEDSIGQRRVESIQDALTILQVALKAENVSPNIPPAVIRLFRDGLKPNLNRDERQMEQLRSQMLDTLEPIIVRVQKGASIIEPSTKITSEQHEQYTEYRKYLQEQDAGEIDIQLAGRMLLVLAMLMAATFYIRMLDRETVKSNGRLALLALVIVCNLALIRFCYQLSTFEQFLYNNELSAVLPYIAPTALAPIIIAILMGSGPGLLAALLISLFTAVMFGNRLDLLVMFFLASTSAIFICRNIRKRGRVVTSGLLAGSVIAVFTLMFNGVDLLPWETITNQMLAGLLTGVAEGIVVAGVLPILEGVFKRTTNITLLELSDYNHPLLRRMQLEAPGTWHHSLMVANLAENACAAIKKNALLARVCCMFHDIGKLVKPEYFTENQKGGINPHDEHSPSFSALIIKSHVKEGVDLGLTFKLPRPIIDIIRQHHGTNLIRFFFHKAREQAENESQVQESTYRYDGPKPQFTESAVILLADSIEAASRSLAKVTPNNVEELVDRIFKANIDDGQLDECPITMGELAKIRKSFIFTLLNSLHSRVAYPGEKKSSESDSSAASQKKPEPATASAVRS